MRKSVASSWLTTLLLHVESKPCVLLRLDEADSARLRESRVGFNEFTLARPHELLSGIKTPTVCLVYETRWSWMLPEGAIDLRHHDAPAAGVAFLLKRPALHFFAAVFRYITGDLARSGRTDADADAETVRPAGADLAFLFAVRAAPHDALPNGARRAYLPSGGGHIKMHGPWGLLLDERSIMKLFMLATFFDKTPCSVSMPVAFRLGRRTAMKSVARGLVGQCRRARRPRAGAHCRRVVAAAHFRQDCAWQRRLRGLPSIQI